MKRMTLLLLMFFFLISMPAFAQRFRFLPQFASGGGWSCDIFISNQGSASVTGIVISFYSDLGAPLSVATSIGTQTSFTINLNAGATQVIRIPATASLQTGYAVIRMPSDASIMTTEVFRSIDNNQILSELGLSQQMARNYYTFPIETSSSRGVRTGLAIVNPTFEQQGATAQTIIVNLINANGALQQTRTLTLIAGEHYTGYPDLDQRLFPGLDEFTGLISLSALNPISVLSLRQDSNTFGAVAVESGPVLGPFTLNGMSAIAETEPNNSMAQAYMLSGNTLITGSIGSSGDLDFYGFSGHAGDLVTAMVDTAGLNSNLDSVIRLQKSTGELVTENDQNGLSSQNDSFLQVILPADGTYYFRVSDYYGNYGSQYTYRLHAMVPTSTTSPPQINTINPASGTQGTTFSITISGTNLSGTSAINFSPSTGITVSNLQSSASQVTAQLTIASGATVGSRQVSLTTPGGTSGTLTFTVNQSGGAGYDGTWNGTTSQGKTISFTVSGGKITSVTVGYIVVGGCCSADGTSTSTGTWNITGNTFTVSTPAAPGAISFTLTGTFASGSQANGTLQLTLTAGIYPQPSCCSGTASATWNASK